MQQEVVVTRARRLDLADVTQHVIQRGNNRQPCFFGEADYLRFLRDLGDAASTFSCRIHAYVLMANHVHLLVTPHGAGMISHMMQAIGRSYVRYVNSSRGRSGTLWDGRYKSCLVDGYDHVLACYRYIERNPVRAGIAVDPRYYRWSSYASNALGAFDPLITTHPAYRLLGDDARVRCSRYRELAANQIIADELDAIRLYAQRQRALGSTQFQSLIEQKLGCRAGIGKPGRPRKAILE